MCQRMMTCAADFPWAAAISLMTGSRRISPWLSRPPSGNQQAIDIRADYVAKYGAPSAAAPKIFFRYYYVNSSTGEKSGTMLAEVKWAAAAAGGGEP